MSDKKVHFDLIEETSIIRFWVEHRNAKVVQVLLNYETGDLFGLYYNEDFIFHMNIMNMFKEIIRIAPEFGIQKLTMSTQNKQMRDALYDLKFHMKFMNGLDYVPALYQFEYNLFTPNEKGTFIPTR